MSASDLDLAYRLFTTTVAFITSHGPKGPNVMSAEWTFNVSYDPFLILISIDPEQATYEAISETGEFGVSLVSEEQIVAMGFAGHFTKRETDKLSSELFETVPSTKIKAPLIRGALLNAECRLVKTIELGDHTGLLGEVVAFTVDGSKRPIVLHRGAHRLGERVTRPPAVALAVTPMAASAGATVTVDGELTARTRAGRAVDVSLLGPAATPLAEASVTTDDYGYFQAALEIPSDAAKGTYAVSARHGEAEGRARVTVR